MIKKGSDYKSNTRSGWLTTAIWIVIILVSYFLIQNSINHKVNPNQHVETHVTKIGDLEKQIIILERNLYHSYVVSGTLNKSKVTFLVDTGATHVTVPDHIAKKLNLNYVRKAIAHTANGKVTIYKTIIPEITIGNIKFRNIAGNISPGLEMDEILLGMSALKKLTIIQKNNKLFLINYTKPKV